jgi:bacterial/archaeal transporter family-2 protein
MAASRWLLIGLVYFAGMFIAVQGPINSNLGKTINSPLVAGLISFLVGTLALTVIVVSQDTHREALGKAFSSGEQWYNYIGGFLGAFYVAVIIFTAPVLGMGLIIGVSVAGQITAALILDQIGAFGLQKITITPLKVFGAIMTCCGVAIARWVPEIDNNSNNTTEVAADG